MDACTTFNIPLYITHVLGISVPKKGVAAYDAVSKHCASKKTIEIKTKEQGTLHLKCPDSLPKREAFIEIESI